MVSRQLSHRYGTRDKCRQEVDRKMKHMHGNLMPVLKEEDKQQLINPAKQIHKMHRLLYVSHPLHPLFASPVTLFCFPKVKRKYGWALPRLENVLLSIPWLWKSFSRMHLIQCDGFILKPKQPPGKMNINLKSHESSTCWRVASHQIACRISTCYTAYLCL